MSATKFYAGLALAAASGLLLITMTGTSFAGSFGGHHLPSCTGTCQTNKAGNPRPVVTNGPAAKPGGSVGNATGGKTLRQN